ncbi:hypothetical protein [Uliginosibacterium sp. 31-12]|uniref:hypothetical protein n=1 Tax=Uliginosibacterium sp. 31-12 TaxID=3062781 RepID=UPI0026E28E4D|nr:hypothetical protein [Uliginosibacterium sp. 31-12]MDO6385625.1 hypothetical protein [Uliginosibacterium sp. 31-12]
MTPTIPEQVAMAMRFDLAPDDALLPLAVIEAGTGMSGALLSQRRKDYPNDPPFTKRGKFVYYRAGAVRKYLAGGEEPNVE